MPKTLADIEVLVLDCQTTGASPTKGHLLELAWCRVKANKENSAVFKIKSDLVALPEDEKIPRRVSALTGITQDDLVAAKEPEEIWAKLSKAALSVAEKQNSSAAPTVIHYARFEEPWLRELHEEFAPDTPFPFEIICTHEIARRMFPNLPRRGLRAVSGYLGHVVPELKRAATHVAATAAVWVKMVPLLSGEHDIDVLDDLREWLAVPPPARGARKIYPLSRERRLSLPDKPGVYRMLGKGGEVLYLGKATSLRKRVNSYFTKQRKVPERTLEMVSQVHDVEVTVTGSPLEAALLENDGIKEHSPPYNVALRGRDRSLWFYSADFQSVQPEFNNNHVIGPIPSRESLAALGQLIPVFEKQKERLMENISATSLLQMPEDYQPEKDIFEQGFEIFMEECDVDRKAKDIRNELIDYGARLWQERLDEMDLAAEEPEEEIEDDEEEKTEWEWNPERVAKAIAWNIAHGANLVRRAWWFCRLSESVLVWQPGTGPDGGLRTLVFERGQVSERKDIDGARVAPLPAGFRLSFEERQRNFDYATYDRLRVLSSELRRLIAEDGYLELRFGPRAGLRRDELAGLLRWV